MTQREMMQDHAMQEFDICFNKHMQTIKNSLSTIIGHAYKEGYKEGLKEARSTEIEPEKTEIRIGDEVGIFDFDDYGKPLPCSRFFVTEYEAGEYIGGIDAEGSTSFHDSGENGFNKWRPTGRHVDIEQMLKMLE